MKENKETNSGAVALLYEMNMRHLGELNDELTIDELACMARFAGGDYALELRGEKLHLFRVLVREVR